MAKRRRKKQGNRQAGPQVDTINPKDLAAEYGWARSVLRSDPELSKIFDRAIAHTWTPERFIAEVRNTGWFQQHSDATRNYLILKTTDPTTFRNRYNQARAAVRDMAVQMGAQLSAKSIDRIADNFLKFGWNDNQLRDTLAGAVKPGALGTFGGDAAENVDHLRSVAHSYGVRISDKTLTDWAVRLAAGESIEGFDEYIKNTAKSAFPMLSDQIDGGSTVEQIANPYREEMARTLELNPEDLDLFDPTIRSAIQGQNKDGQPATMPLWQFSKQLRKDPRWLQTDNARETLMGATRSVLQDFGLVS